MVEQIFSGWLNCRVRRSADGAILEPFDESAEACKEFHRVVAKVLKHKGDGYGINSLAGPDPNGSPDMVWITCDDAELARQKRESIGYPNLAVWCNCAITPIKRRAQKNEPSIFHHKIWKNFESNHCTPLGS